MSKLKPTIESNYFFGMHEEGCSSSQHALLVPVAAAEDGHFFPELGDEPNHPKTFVFPKRKFGDKKPTYRSFQSSWFEKWPWISYNETEDKAFCFICIKAVQQERVRECTLTSKTSNAFLTQGYTNWKDATGEKHGGFPLHERSHVSFCCYIYSKHARGVATI